MNFRSMFLALVLVMSMVVPVAAQENVTFSAYDSTATNATTVPVSVVSITIPAGYPVGQYLVSVDSSWTLDTTVTAIGNAAFLLTSQRGSASPVTRRSIVTVPGVASAVQPFHTSFVVYHDSNAYTWTYNFYNYATPGGTVVNTDTFLTATLITK